MSWLKFLAESASISRSAEINIEIGGFVFISLLPNKLAKPMILLRNCSGHSF